MMKQVIKHTCLSFCDVNNETLYTSHLKQVNIISRNTEFFILIYTTVQTDRAKRCDSRIALASKFIVWLHFLQERSNVSDETLLDHRLSTEFRNFDWPLQSFLACLNAVLFLNQSYIIFNDWNWHFMGIR